MQFILIVSIIMGASIVQGATSFGFSLVALPLLGLILPLKEIVPLLVGLSLILNLIILVQLKRLPNFKDILILFVSGVICIPLGVKLLLFVEEPILKRSVSLFLIVVAVMMIGGFKIRIKNKNLSYAVTGILSGLLNGSVSLSGPPIVILLSNDEKNRDDFRASLTTLFVLYNIVTYGVFFSKGLLTIDFASKYSPIIPFLLIGTFIGVKIGNKIDENKFRQMVLYLLVIMGIINLF